MMRFTLLTLAAVPVSGSAGFLNGWVKEETDGPSGSSFAEDVIAPVDSRRLSALGCKWHDVSVEQRSFSMDQLSNLFNCETVWEESCTNLPGLRWDSGCGWFGCFRSYTYRACVSLPSLKCPVILLRGGTSEGSTSEYLANGDDDNCFRSKHTLYGHLMDLAYETNRKHGTAAADYTDGCTSEYEHVVPNGCEEDGRTRTYTRGKIDRTQRKMSVYPTTGEIDFEFDPSTAANAIHECKNRHLHFEDVAVWTDKQSNGGKDIIIGFAGSRFGQDGDGCRDTDADIRIFTGEAFGTNNMAGLTGFLDFISEWLPSDLVPGFDFDQLFSGDDEYSGDGDQRFREAAQFVNKVCQQADADATITLTGNSLGAALSLEVNYLLRNEFSKVSSGSNYCTRFFAGQFEARPFNAWLGTGESRLAAYLAEQSNTFYISFQDFATASLKYALHNGHTAYGESIYGDALKATIIRTEAPQTSDACDAAVAKLADAQASGNFDVYYSNLANDCGGNSGMTCVGQVQDTSSYSSADMFLNLARFMASLVESKFENFVYHHTDEQWTNAATRPRSNCWDGSGQDRPDNHDGYHRRMDGVGNQGAVHHDDEEM